MTKQQIGWQCQRQIKVLLKKHFGNIINDALLRRPEGLDETYFIDLPHMIADEYRAFLYDIWQHVQHGDASFETIIDIQANLFEVDDRYNQRIRTAYIDAKRITAWELISKTNYRDVNRYKGLLYDYTNEILQRMATSFMENIKDGDSVSPYIKREKYDVFISCNSLDYLVAKEIYEFLTSQDYVVFFAETSISEAGDTVYKKTIDAAMDSATHFVLVTTDVAHLNSKWVDYEINMFQNEKLSGRKTGNVVSVVAPNIDIGMLPISLRVYHTLTLDDYKSQLCNFLWRKGV